MNAKNPTPDENKILLHLLKRESDTVAFKDLTERKINWDTVINLSEEHRVLPLAFKRLKSEYSEFIDREILEEFLIRYQETAKFNFARSSQLIELVGCLQKSDIPVIAYKGMALAKCAYRDVSLRQFGDIDLFIRKNDFSRVNDLFTNVGCRPAWDLRAKQQAAVLKYYYEFPYFYGEINTLVEVHWEFLESFFTFEIDLNDVWNRAVNIDLYGKQMSTLSNEDYVVILCTHGSKHFWRRLSWMCDIAKLVENTKIDWKLVKRIAISSGSLRMVTLGLYLTNKLFDTDLPGELAEEARNDREVHFLAGKIENFLKGAETEPTEWTEVAKLHSKMREKITTKIRYSYRLFTTKLVDKLFMPMGRPR